MRTAISITIFLFIIFPTICWCQSGTKYYDEFWKETTRKNAKYVETYEQQPDKRYKAEYRIADGDRLYSTCYYSSIDSTGIKDGASVTYSENGFVASEGNYVNNKQTGEWKNYYPDSKELWYSEEFKNGEISSLTSYYEDGKLKRKETHNGPFVTGKCYDKTGTEITFTQFEIMPKPSFDLGKYLSDNLHYPDRARERNIEGRVITKFVVDEDGSITDVEVVKHVSKDIDAEAVRVIEKMPAWTPGRRDDKIVKVYFHQPISFKLE